MESRLREWRKAQNLTLDEVAALTGYSEVSVSLIERGKRKLRPLDKVKFARSLGVPLRTLFEFEEPEPVDLEEVSTP